MKHTHKEILLLSPEIIKLYNENNSIKTIAKLLGINVKTARKVLRDDGIQIRGAKKNLLGKKFGRMTPLRIDGQNQKSCCYWSCRCDCGNIKTVLGQDLASGRIQSCGCYHKESSSRNMKKCNDVVRNDINKSTFKGIKEISGKYITAVKCGAMSRKFEYELSNEFLWELFIKQDRKCALTGIDLVFNSRYNNHAKQTASLDRIDSKKGYLENNVQWIHKDINFIKQDYPEPIFIKYCELISKLARNKKGVLFGTRTYLAGNLEFSSDTINWRKTVKDKLSEIGIISLNPMDSNFIDDFAESDENRNLMIKKRQLGEWEFVQKYMDSVIKKDLRMIDIVDFVIFNFEFDKPTYGTVHELILSKTDKKPIFVIAENKKKVPLWLVGLIPEKYIYESIDDVIDTLYRINSGEIKIDSEKWKLLKHELR